MKLFSRNFDEEKLERDRRADEERRSAQARTFTAMEVDAMLLAARNEARQEGHEAGHRLGLEEAGNGIAARAATAAGVIASDLSRLQAELADHRLSVERDMGAFIRLAVGRLLPDLVAHLGAARFEEEIRSICQRAMGADRIRIRVSPGNLTEVRRILVSAEGGIDRYALVGDETLDDTAAIANWPGGGSDYSFRRLCDAIKDMTDKLPGADRIRQAEQNLEQD